MAKGTYIQKGEIIDYTNSSGVAIGYGDVVLLTSRIGIAAENIPSGMTGSLKTEGVYELPAVNNAAFTVGDPLYWDGTAGNLTKTASGNILAGWCFEAKATATAVAKIKIG